MSDQVKLQFINDTLKWYGVNVEEAVITAARRLGVEDTSALINSIKHKVLKAAGGDQGSVQLIFHEYGRMVDMGAGRKPIETADDRRSKRTGRQARKFYSKTAYGLLDRLIYRLSNYYTEEAIAGIKSRLEPHTA
jgi:hypothetical protein